ncbi:MULTISPECIES: asparagine synthase-related protein [unclassified Nocardioides]|uniref:asparagine synthase-related protein n=1 Tax=unclassified Nocardioides TaxID=2615069 RepID=UPI00070245A3|nr:MULTISPECIES: asparagine synthase-related protein [unclassified Nocardioides]
MAPPDTNEVFRATPFVCGYVGPGDTALWARLRAAAPVELTAEASGPHHAVAASTAPLLDRSASAWTWGRYVIDRRRPADWRDAAHELGLAGLWASADGARLHTDLSGLHDVFHRSIGGTTYFATRIAPLRDLAPGLDTDWDGWGTSLAFGGFIGTATPFRQVHRLPYGGSITADATGIAHHHESPAWLGDEAPAAGIGEVAAAFRRAVPGPLTRTPHHVTLSGGWDSRLIALAMVRNRTRRPTAWTVDPDTGVGHDVEIARAVAQALRLEHRVVPSGGHSWGRHRPNLLARVEHLTWMHTWLGPLASRVRHLSGPVVDGLGGDVLLRNLFTDAALLAAPSRDERLDLQLHALGGGRITARRPLAPALAQRWADAAREQMTATGDRWSGHPSEYVLRALAVRTSRVIAPSPMRLFAPEAAVLLPFMDPAVLRTALAVPVAAKTDHTFYRGLLAALHPRVGPMPSTNDGLPKTPERPRSQTRRSAIAPMVEAVLADEVVLGLLSAAMIRRLRRGGRTLPDDVPLAALQWAAALADWRATNRAHLRVDDVPER